MYPGRREKIYNLLQTKPFVSLHELENLFPNVSSMTLRRDIEYMEEIGEAIKVRGGAKSMKFITASAEDSFSLRANENILGKDRIASVAAGMFETGRSIFLDSGTTALRLASIVPDERMNITTTGPNVAMELGKKHFPIVSLVGGMFNRENISVSGTQALEFLSDVNIDTAFIVPSGVSSGNGFTCGNYSEYEIKQLIVRKARYTVILMDESKFGRSLPYTFADFSDVDVIISDCVLPIEMEACAQKGQTQIIVAGS